MQNQVLQDGDSEVRKTFALQFLVRVLIKVDWPWNILWSGEAQFSLNGQINIHSYRIRARENPHATNEQPFCL